MIWAYPYFRKPTYLFKVSFTSEWEVSISSPFYNPGTTLVELYRHILGLCKTVKITNRNNIDLKNKYNWTFSALFFCSSALKPSRRSYRDKGPSDCRRRHIHGISTLRDCQGVIECLSGSIQNHPETSWRMQVYHGISTPSAISMVISTSRCPWPRSWNYFPEIEKKEPLSYSQDITKTEISTFQPDALSVPGSPKSRTATRGVLPEFDLEEVWYIHFFSVACIERFRRTT